MSYRDNKENLHIPHTFIATWCVSTEQGPKQASIVLDIALGKFKGLLEQFYLFIFVVVVVCLF